MFSRIIYLLAIMDAVLFAIFHYKLSFLSEAELMTDIYGGSSQSLWFTFGACNFFIFLCVCLQYKRSDFGGEFGGAFGITHTLHKKIATVFFCDLVPLILLSMFLFLAIRSLNGLPG